ncbi:DUF2867 domain-containing protein [Labrenzia sp. PHM005]|uniref:DUF2867 domain-containing protein n=1 Tax=Labrenzia sp. PHM005 TaxID=2590016 RepID=UPI00113FDC6C|nr:DUF2867 domain-containing protein [Labrenzia sp. PHM005]QDG77781.1 DUF2867 domain-containing protein [Labrenzia sp. PHM005]
MIAADTLPLDSQLNAYRQPKDFMDVYSGDLSVRPDLLECDIRAFGVHFTTIDMAWAQKLLILRDQVVRPLGLKTTKDLAKDGVKKPVLDLQAGDRIQFFKIYQIGADEILLGEDDWHQDFRLSVFRKRGPSPRVYVSTCCQRHNIFGHAYLAAILPFHKMLVKQSLENGLKRPLGG